MLSRLVITFLLRSKRLLISWLQSPSAVILEPQKIKSNPVSTLSPSIYHEVMGPDAMISGFWMLSFKPAFSLSSFTFIMRLFNSSLLSAIRVMSSAYLRLLTFLYIKKMWKWKSLIRVWLCKPLDYTVHRILQVRIVEWVAYLLQEVFPTQGSNPGLLHCRQILHQLSHKGSPYQENGDSILLVLDPILVLDPRLIV